MIINSSDFKINYAENEFAQVFPNRAESYIILIILATVSAIYLFIWIGRKSYYMFNPSAKKIFIVQKK